VAAGWPAERTTRVSEIIVLHLRDDVAPTDDPEQAAQGRYRGSRWTTEGIGR
jgi:hypothetical protein